MVMRWMTIVWGASVLGAGRGPGAEAGGGAGTGAGPARLGDPGGPRGLPPWAAGFGLQATGLQEASFSSASVGLSRSVTDRVDRVRRVAAATACAAFRNRLFALPCARPGPSGWGGGDPLPSDVSPPLAPLLARRPPCRPPSVLVRRRNLLTAIAVVAVVRALRAAAPRSPFSAGAVTRVGKSSGFTPLLTKSATSELVITFISFTRSPFSTPMRFTTLGASCSRFVVCAC
mmetsp:Transcript_80498/g.214916  ORF Transcript_80498/g.214916 Transcript_80498/m.214916 type:complete len:231 (-) Transcript_80498:394-1086(-)